QDIAKQRFNLAKQLVDVCGAKIVAVGDDWQSIFAFSGADINLFIEFDKFMGKGDRLQITHTYRNSQELIDIAGRFVQENPIQIKKALRSPKSKDNPVIIKIYDDSFEIMKNKVKVLLEAVREIVSESGVDAEILFIGRYGFDIHQLCKTGEFEENERSNMIFCKKFPQTRITYLTAHASKGLGYDNVIILNGAEGKFGFPSQIEDDPIMKLVLVQDNSMVFAEERRLFYVALTRTKNRVYILTPSGKPSRFVLELAQQYKIRIDGEISETPLPSGGYFAISCPKCGFPLKKEYNKNYGLTLYHCTNEPEICDFMTNRSDCLKDIYKCSYCKEGYMIIKKNSKNESFFFGCTNYDSVPKCRHTENC
ncbi:MAG: DNA helicase UvrD, partial [Lachnoclostridium sp.]|nr:DNA helicase UvrD [Lachnoclostridium sp.]